MPVMAIEKNLQVIPFRLLAACKVGSGSALLGWAEDELNPLSVINCFHSDGHTENFVTGKGELPLIRTVKPEFTASGLQIRHRDTISAGRGFAVMLPVPAERFGAAMLTLNNQVADLDRVRVLAPEAILAHEGYLSVYGHALLAFATEAGDRKLAGQLTTVLTRHAEQTQVPAGSLDQAWEVDGQLLLAGKIDCDQSQLRKVVLKTGRTSLDLTGQLQTALVPRSELNLRRSAGDLVCVFYILMDIPVGLVATRTGKASGSKPAVRKITLDIDTLNLGRLVLHASLHHCELAFLRHILQAIPAAAEGVLAGLAAKFRKGAAAKTVREATREHFIRQWARSEEKIRYGKTFAAGAERTFQLGEDGLLVYGWLIYPLGNAVRIWLHAVDSAPVEVTDKLVFIELDKHHKLRREFPRSGDSPFFVLHADLATMPGDRRALRFAVAGLPDAWMKLDTTTLHEQGMPLIRELVSALPRSDNLRLQMITLFNGGLGKVIERAALEQTRISQRQATTEVPFGEPVKRPAVSLIIPLYGRCDYMRHQLAAFAEDRDFSRVDLIYVVDDPGLLPAALDLAGRYQPLFDIPFRVISYGENRGFAGANNAAVKVARAPLLLLMNSDVLPQQPGWITKLRNALQKLPKAVMTAPLLQYADNSLQHAGMRPVRHHAYPGFIFSYHPGKGQQWDGDNKPSEQLMLTGACLLISKRAYMKAGGLDEGYLVGDFEDSDLSLRLKSGGGRLYLVPAAKLWHLERQSQYLGAHTTTLRDLLTLYNGWRYKQKIDAGLLPDPEKIAGAGRV
jgi:GT2 family glycosyltransferase